MRLRVSRLAGWIGAAVLTAAPFLMHQSEGKALAIVGLLLVSIPLFEARIWPLLLSNAVGIFGYIWSLTA